MYFFFLESYNTLFSPEIAVLKRWEPQGFVRTALPVIAEPPSAVPASPEPALLGSRRQLAASSHPILAV